MALGALGRLAGDQHRLAQRRRLLLDAAGVGDHQVGTAQQAANGGITERLGQQHVVEAGRRSVRTSRTCGLGCIGRTKRTSGSRGESGDALGDPRQAVAPVLAPVGGHHHDPAIAVVQRLQLRLAKLTVIPEPSARASMPVLPVTKICPTGTSSRTRSARLGGRGEVQARDARDQLPVELLGERRQVVAPVRRPASTCITGMRRWKAESAADIAELVSPWTSTAAGRFPRRISLAARPARRGRLEPLDAEVLEAPHHRGDPLVELGAATRPELTSG